MSDNTSQNVGGKQELVFQAQVETSLNAEDIKHASIETPNSSSSREETTADISS